jgi:hypothetical protein
LNTQAETTAGAVFADVSGRNVIFPLTSSTVLAVWPFVFEQLTDSNYYYWVSLIIVLLRYGEFILTRYDQSACCVCLHGLDP